MAFSPSMRSFEGRIVQIGHTCLDGVVEALQAQFRFGGALVQFRDVLAATVSPFLPPVENGGENGLQPLGIEQALLQMLGDQIVKLLHWHGHALACRRPLPGLGRAGIIAVAAALSGPDGHGSAAPGAVDETSEHGRAADHASGHDLGVAGFEESLHRLERLAVDDRRHRNGHRLADRLPFLGFEPLVELMLADIGAPGEDAVHLADAPAATVAGEDAVAV
jgi:hypothetical protein